MLHFLLGMVASKHTKMCHLYTNIAVIPALTNKINVYNLSVRVGMTALSGQQSCKDEVSGQTPWIVV